MERKRDVPEAVVIAQDERTEVHIQALVQSGRRHLDIRVWRRGSGGLAPSRRGVTLDAADLQTLRQGITELLHASEGGLRVARVVWDGEDGRRLRAETEPFGTRFMAKFGFWQRVRDRWKQADDGLTISADRLRQLHNVLERFLPWLNQSAHTDVDTSSPPSPGKRNVERWPHAGADWLTIGGDQIVFHPKGLRFTCSVQERAARHTLILTPWGREDMLWLPEKRHIVLSISDVDRLISHIGDFADAQAGSFSLERHRMTCENRAVLTVSVEGDPAHLLLVSETPPERPGETNQINCRLHVPASYLGRFGRFMSQGRALLAGWLSEAEREALVKGTQLPTNETPNEAPANEANPTDETTELPSLPVQQTQTEAEDIPPASTDLARSTSEASVAGTQVLSFGTESGTPGTVIVADGQVRLLIESEPYGASLAIPTDAISRVIAGLEHLDVARRRQNRVDPLLFCDRPGCTVYGRLGTPNRAEVVELRAWSSSIDSSCVSFEAACLPDLVQTLQGVLDGTKSRSRLTLAVSGSTLAPFPDFRHPWRWRHVAPRSPLNVPGPLPSAHGLPDEVAPLAVSLGSVTLGGKRRALELHGNRTNPALDFQWESTVLELNVNRLDALLAEVRALYYNALRGQRGRRLTIGSYPVTTIAVQNRGPQLYCVMEQEEDGETIELAFAVSEVPVFLDAVQTALAYI